jgi:hypothetical protein
MSDIDLNHTEGQAAGGVRGYMKRLAVARLSSSHPGAEHHDLLVLGAHHEGSFCVRSASTFPSRQRPSHILCHCRGRLERTSKPPSLLSTGAR